MEGKTPVTSWYNDRTIFVTGGSGFMGKVMLEKLLFACPGIKRIYILLRNKRGKTPQQRIDIMWKLACFDRLRKAQPDAFKKVVPVNGDVNTDELGLKTSDLNLLINDVSVVFHMAATLKLEANLKDAIEQNTAGTARVIDVCKKMKKLEAFIHFSTAFCSADLDVFEERVYENRDDPRQVIEVVNWFKPGVLDNVTPRIIAPHPNTYTYSKRLAENLVANEKDNMPVCIVRPSIVIPASLEPVPGWVDSLNGPIGLIVGAGKGVIRSMHCKGDSRGQFIPVDYAINSSIVIAYLVGTKQTNNEPGEVPVYNFTMDPIVSQTYRQIIDTGRHLVYKHPFEMCIWYPDGDIREHKFTHNIYSFFFHWIPALLIDLLMFICGQKTFMIRIQKKIYDGLELLQFFSTRVWRFRAERFLALNDQMTADDQKIFSTRKPRVLDEYFEESILGVRQYCLKEDLSSLPRCRNIMKVLYVLHKVAVYGFYYYMLSVLSKYIYPIKIVFDFLNLCLSYIPLIGYFFVVSQPVTS